MKTYKLGSMVRRILLSALLVVSTVSSSLQAISVDEIKQKITDLKTLVTDTFKKWKENPKAETPALLDNLAFEAVGKIPAQTITILDSPSIKLVNPNLIKFAELPKNMAQGYILRGAVEFAGQTFGGEFFTLETKNAAGNVSGIKFRGFGIELGTSGTQPTIYDLVTAMGITAPDALKNFQMPGIRIVVTQNFADDKIAGSDVFKYQTSTNQTVEIKPGLNIVATVPLTGAFEYLQNFINSVTGQPITATGGTMNLAVQTPLENMSLSKVAISAALAVRFGIDFTKLKDPSLSTKLNLRAFNFGDFLLKVTPANGQLALGAKATLEMLNPKQPALNFSADGELGKEGWKFQAMMDGMWDPAFGIDWLGIGNLRFTIGQSTNPVALQVAAVAGVPFTQLGFAGTLALGTNDEFKISLNGDIDTTLVPPLFGFAGKLDNELKMADIIAWIGRDVFKKSIQATDLPEITIKKNSGLAFATAPGTIGNTVYKQGFNLLFDAVITGYQAKLDIMVDTEEKKFKGEVWLGEMLPDNKLGPIKIKINDTPIVNISDFAGTGALNGRLFLDFNDTSKDEFKFDGQVAIPAIDLSMKAKLGINNDGFNGDFEFAISDQFSADVELKINPKKIDELYVMMKFQQKFQDALIKAVEDWGKTKVKVEIEQLLNAAKSELEKAKKANAYMEYIAAVEANKRHEQANRALVDCKKQYNNLSWIEQATISAAWVPPFGTAGALLILDQELPACKVVVGANVLELKSSLEAANSLILEKITDAMLSAVTKVDDWYEKEKVDEKFSEAINDTIGLISKVVAGALKIFKVRSGKVVYDGKKLKEGQSPALSLDAEIDLTDISKDIGKIPLKFDDVSFNFKSVGDSIKNVAEQIWNKIKDPLLNFAKELAAKALTEEGRADLADKVFGKAPATEAPPSAEYIAAQKVLAETNLRINGAEEIALRKSLNKPFDKGAIESALNTVLTQAQYDAMVGQEALSKQAATDMKVRFKEETAIEKLAPQVQMEKKRRDQLAKSSEAKGVKKEATLKPFNEWLADLVAAENLPEPSKARVLATLQRVADGARLSSVQELQKLIADNYSKKIGGLSADTIIAEMNQRIIPRLQKGLGGGSPLVIMRVIADVYSDTNYAITDYPDYLEVRPEKVLTGAQRDEVVDGLGMFLVLNGGNVSAENKSNIEKYYNVFIPQIDWDAINRDANTNATAERVRRLYPDFENSQPYKIVAGKVTAKSEVSKPKNQDYPTQAGPGSAVEKM